MLPEDVLRRQVIDDMAELTRLIQEYAITRNVNVKRARDRLDGAVKVKLAMMHAAQRATHQMSGRRRIGQTGSPDQLN